MLRLLFVILMSTASISAIAGREHFVDFADSLNDKYGFETGHLLDLTDKIYIAKPSLLQRWGVLSAHAEATYNNYLNTIILKPKNFIEVQGFERVRNYEEFKQGNVNYFNVRAQTIFHELMHGDYDVFIEENENSLLAKELPRWMRKNVGLRGKGLAHEFIGYTAGQIIEVLDFNIEKVLLQFGIYPHEDKCFKKEVLLRKTEQYGLKEKLEFKDFIQKDLWGEMQASTIFLGTKDYQVNHIPSHFSQELKNYFKSQYGIKTSSEELVQFMNHSNYFEKLKRCYSFLTSGL